MVQEILKAVSPRAVRQAEIRKALQDKGVSLAYPSIGYALAQLQERKAARQVGKSGNWRHS
jgi:repressor of nif and glnA expression